MKLYLIRHGKTGDHEKQIRQSPQSPLGKVGHSQAKALAKRLSQGKYDVLLASPWPRALETAEHLAKELKLPIEIYENIHEQHQNPKVHSLKYTHKLAKKYLAEAHEHGRKSMDWKFEGDGESRRELIQRAREFKQYLESNYVGKSVVVVSHGGFMSALIPVLIAAKMSLEDIWRLSYSFYTFENTSVSLLEYTPERDEWSLRYFNDASHLNSV